MSPYRLQRYWRDHILRGRQPGGGRRGVACRAASTEREIEVYLQRLGWRLIR